jgi:hypothetical protein
LHDDNDVDRAYTIHPVRLKARLKLCAHDAQSARDSPRCYVLTYTLRNVANRKNPHGARGSNIECRYV